MYFENYPLGSELRTVAWQNTCGMTGKPPEEKQHFMKMVTEEFWELVDAHNKYTEKPSDENKIEVFDALGDLGFTLQTLALLGYDVSLSQVIGIIQKSNETKICKSLDEAEETVELYINGKHPDKPGKVIHAKTEKVGEYWIVRDSKTNKVLKSKNFKKPYEELKKLIS